MEIGQDVEWVYIMRLDGAYVSGKMALGLGRMGGVGREGAVNAVKEHYDAFCNTLQNELTEAFEDKGKVELHIYGAEDIEQAVGKIVGQVPCVSLDPLIDNNQLKVSRGYYLGGMTDHGLVTRPGSGHLADQARTLMAVLGQKEIKVIEDDVFSGGSLMAALIHLLRAGFEVGEVVPGIQVGRPSGIEDLGIAVSPAVSYRCAAGDIFEKVDLGDPRDFLAGASGLVTKLPSGHYGRLPYLLPFVSPSARASIPSHREREFSLRVLKANERFFEDVGGSLNTHVRVGQMDEHFQAAVYEVMGIQANEPMAELCRGLAEHLDEIWDKVQRMGDRQIQEAKK